jgi:hypothetical protein
MTLHKTVEMARKFFLGVLLGIAAIFVLMLIFRLGVMIKNTIFPPKVMPANHAFGILPTISFPKNATNANLTYEINTVTGELPDFQDRINVYPISQPQPNLVNLNKAKSKVRKLGFVNESGILLPETPIGDANYTWAENTGIGRRMTFDTITFDFNLKSNFLSSPTVNEAKLLSNEENAIKQTAMFLNLLELLPPDVDMTKSQSELFSIQNGLLTPETNLLRAKVIRIDLYQNDVEYNLNTGVPDLAGGFKEVEMTIPIAYPHPPYSTMNFLIASGDQSAEVVSANFIHKTPIFDNTDTATYYIKTPTDAFDELKNGKAYIASYAGSKTTVVINNIYLAYYLGEEKQEYLMPVIVFEGDDGFVAYVSAVKTEWVK